MKAKKAAYEQATYADEKAVLNAFKEARNAIVEFNKTRDIYSLQTQRRPFSEFKTSGIILRDEQAMCSVEQLV